MIATIIMIVLVLVAIAALVVAVVASDSETKGFSAGLGAVLIVVAVILGLFTTITHVEAKEVGIVTVGGKVSEQTLQPGYHGKKPWEKVTSIDATIQTDEYHGDRAINVVLSDKNTADISATIRWSVNEKNANEVYSKFRSDDPTKNLRDNVVSTQFKAAVNAVFASYDATSTTPPDYDALAASVEQKMLAHTNGLVDIDSVTISYIKPSKAVQDKINQIQAQVAKTRIAEEAKTTATKEAEANRILSESISHDPNVLVSKCLDIVAENPGSLPAGFQCWSGTGGSVVVPSAK